jgi:tetratricopeptide (TPR) repeat protein
MHAPRLSLVLLGVSCFTLATWVGPRLDQFFSRRDPGLTASMLGESRKLFANHFFTRSDIYFHSGYYPTIFDQGKEKPENHLAETAGAAEPKHPAHGEPGHVHDEHEDEDEDEENFLGHPKDPMDAFTRHFFVSQHAHLTEKGTNAPKEILPWIKLAAQFDPGKVESYTVGAYWLRQLNKNDEAEQFLREGFRQNPHSYEIMLELGRGYLDKREHVRARNILEMAIARWHEQEDSKPADKQNAFAAAQILNFLAVVEDRSGDREKTIHWLEMLKKISPRTESIAKRIEDVRAGKPLTGE